MAFLSDFKKLFSKKVISSFTWLYIYCFVYTLSSNFFTCSYLIHCLSTLENHFMYLYLFFCLVCLNKNRCHSLSYVNKYLNVKHLNLFLNSKYYNCFINILFNKLFNKLLIFNFRIKSSLFFCTLNKIYLILKSNTILWYPVFKSYSIFGFYKSTRLKYTDLKNENLKRLKY